MPEKQKRISTCFKKSKICYKEQRHMQIPTKKLAMKVSRPVADLVYSSDVYFFSFLNFMRCYSFDAFFLLLLQNSLLQNSSDFTFFSAESIFFTPSLLKFPGNFTFEHFLAFVSWLRFIG